MIRETIAAVQETETKAEQIVKAAEQEAEAILEDAKKEAETITANAGSQSKVRAAEALKQLQTDREHSLAKANQAVMLEIGELRTQAKSREEGAVKLILSHVFD